MAPPACPRCRLGALLLFVLAVMPKPAAASGQVIPVLASPSSSSSRHLSPSDTDHPSREREQLESELSPDASPSSWSDDGDAEAANPFPFAFPLAFFGGGGGGRPPRPLVASAAHSRPRRPANGARLMGSGNFGILRGGIFNDHDLPAQYQQRHHSGPFDGDRFFHASSSSGNALVRFPRRPLGERWRP